MKNVGDLCRGVVIDKKIRERKSLGSFSSGFQVGKLKKKVCFAKGCRCRSGWLFSFVLKKVVPFLFGCLRFISDLNIHVTGS